MSQILSTSATAIFLTSFAGVFNISTEKAAQGVSADDDRWCFIDGLKLSLSVEIAMISSILSVFDFFV